MELTYKKVEREDVPLLKQIQATIFPESSFEKGYDLLYEKGPAALDSVVYDSYITYADGEPAGITGFQITNGVEEHHSIWLGWFGILPSFRGKKLGKRALLDSIEMAKMYMQDHPAKRFSDVGKALTNDYPVKYFRLYTGEFVNPSAQPLYNSVMKMKEYYTHEELYSEANLEKFRKSIPGLTDEQMRQYVDKCTTVFSLSLDEKEILVPWNNYFLNLSLMMTLEKTDPSKIDLGNR